MNAAPLQHFERWDIHNEGTQPAVRAVTDRARPASASRCAKRSATARRTIRWPTTTTTTAGCTATRTRSSSSRATGASTSTCTRHRYITEDTELGLAFLASVARCAGVDAPIAARAAGRGRRLPRARPAARAAHARGAGPGGARAAQALQRACTNGGTHERWLAFAAVGAGRMGRGIAIAFAYAGHRIALVDLSRARDDAWHEAARRGAGRDPRQPGTGWPQLGAIDAAQVAAIAARVELVDAGARARRARRRRAGVRRRARDAGRQARRVRAAQPAVPRRRHPHVDHQQHPGDPAGRAGAPARALPQHALAQPGLRDPGGRAEHAPGHQRRRAGAHDGAHASRSASCRWCAARRPATSCRGCRRW